MQYVNTAVTKAIAETLSFLGDAEQALSKELYVAGGAIASLLRGQHPNDWDIYTTDVAINAVVMGLIRKKITSEGWHPSGDHAPVITSEPWRNGHRWCVQPFAEYTNGTHRIILTRTATTIPHLKTQIIHTFCGKPDDVVQNFDFRCIKHWSNGARESFDADGLLDLLKMKLVYTGSDFPLASMIRMLKYQKKGFTVSAGEIAKCALDIGNLNLKDHDVLKEQLYGVDLVLFHRVIMGLPDEYTTKDFALLCDAVFGEVE